MKKYLLALVLLFVYNIAINESLPTQINYTYVPSNSTEKKESYVNKYYHLADSIGKIWNVNTKLILAVGAWESGWGKSGMYLRSKNLFSIRGSYKGQTIEIPNNGNFKVYNTDIESIEDFCKLLNKGIKYDSTIYHKVLLAPTLDDQFKEFHESPYCKCEGYYEALVKTNQIISKIIDKNTILRFEYGKPTEASNRRE